MVIKTSLGVLVCVRVSSYLGFFEPRKGLQIPLNVATFPPCTPTRHLQDLFRSAVNWRCDDSRHLAPDCLEGQGDLVSRLTTPITHIVTPFLPVINLLTKSP